MSDTHLGLDLPARPRVVRRRRGDDFFRNFELALAPAIAGEVDDRTPTLAGSRRGPARQRKSVSFFLDAPSFGSRFA